MIETHFNEMLDADPGDHAVRLLYAEWLDDRGDERAAGYRWLAGTHKAPTAWFADGESRPGGVWV